MLKTLEDLVKETETGDIKEQLASVLSALKEQDEDKLNEFSDMLASVVSSQKELTSALRGVETTLKSILSKPDPKFPEPKDIVFPEAQRVTGEVSMARPSWYVAPKNDDMVAIHQELVTSLTKALKPLFMGISKAITQSSEETQDLLVKLLNKEHGTTTKDELVNREKTLGSVRRKSKWVRASTMDGNITGTQDGSNKTFYLPSAPIQNSESVRWNMGNPLSQGEDYRLTGNKIVFTLAPEAADKIEIRYQT